MALSNTLLRRVQARKDDDELSELRDETSEDELSEVIDTRNVDTRDADDDVDFENRNQDWIPNNLENTFDHENEDSNHTSLDNTEEETAQETSHFLEHSEAESGSDKSDQPETQNVLSSVSFGALASAQQSLGHKRKRNIADPQGERNIRDASPFREAEEREAGKKIKYTNTAPRSSKNAPMEFSSKKAVSRKRQVVSIPKVNARDPRFSSLSGDLDVDRVNQKYAFLNDYRASEIADLKQQARNTKDVKAKEALKREIKSMEDRERARKRAEEEKAVVREHRKGESERVKQGKKPYFLKKGEIKKQASVKRFEGMGEKKAEKVMERRRKKKAGKEKKAIPRTRRKVD